jgi:hypothetical protein
MTHDQHGLGRHVFCPKCGTGSSADDSYCSSCGRLLVTRTSHAVGSAVSEARPVPAAPRRLQVPAAAPPRLRRRNKWPAGKWFRAAVLLLLLGGVDVAHAAVTHRAAGSGGTIAFIAFAGASYGLVKWWKLLRHPLLPYRTKKQIAVYWLAVCAGFFVAAGEENAHGHQHVAGILGGIGGCLLAGPLLILMCWAIHKVIADIFNELTVATTPIPSPHEIARQLEEEWGRPATLTEVAAVHQMLHNRRSEAMLNAGIGLGALYLIHHDLHGK